MLNGSPGRSDKAGDLQYPLDLVEASKSLLETSKAMKDTDACGVLGVLDRYLPPDFSDPHQSSSDAGKLTADICDIAVYDHRNILECWSTRRGERKPQGDKSVLDALRVLG